MSLSQEKRNVIHLFPHCAKDRLAGDDKLQVCSGCSTPLLLLKSHNEIEDFLLVTHYSYYGIGNANIFPFKLPLTGGR